jgi:hypothetical protein
VSAGDVRLWAEWLFFVPGDAVIALIGPMPLGRFLELTPASFGSITSAVISAAVCLLAIYGAVCLPGFFMDIVDPTHRQQKREWRQAQRARKQRARLMQREPQRFSRRDGGRQIEPRREPRFDRITSQK